MEFKITVKGLAETRTQATAYYNRLRDLNPPIQRSSVLVLASAQGRIETGGDGNWAPTLESSKGTSLNRNGALLRSLTRGGSGNLWQDIPHGLRVGTNLTTGDGYNVGRLMQEGTGIYGPRGAPITPKNGKFLVFVINGQRIFARSVKGAPPRPFLFISDDDAKRSVGIFEQYIRGQESFAGS
jgi:phage gpG-like protein